VPPFSICLRRVALVQLRAQWSAAASAIAGSALTMEHGVREALYRGSDQVLGGRVSVADVDVSGKVVLVRADLDVPLREIKAPVPKLTRRQRRAGVKPPPPPPSRWEVADDAKVRALLPTLNHLASARASVVIVATHVGGSHLPVAVPSADGRPPAVVYDAPQSVQPVADALKVRRRR
jgi:hypothetical protein